MFSSNAGLRSGIKFAELVTIHALTRGRPQVCTSGGADWWYPRSDSNRHFTDFKSVASAIGLLGLIYRRIPLCSRQHYWMHCPSMKLRVRAS